MKILFTGASSFSGFWFVSALAAAGHRVFVTMTRSRLEDYDGLRYQRIKNLDACISVLWGARFGEQSFQEVLADEGPWDLVCHHAAEVTDYKSPDFDVIGALRNNVAGLKEVLGTLLNAGRPPIILTGTVFEFDEGEGTGERRAFSPYGLSKGLTWHFFRFYCEREDFRLGKFVIPNPFGPFENPLFTNYLMRAWLGGDTPVVQTPEYVRDNIHVDLLARAYVRFSESMVQSEEGLQVIRPSGYVGRQGAFATRFADEMSRRLGIDCPVKLAHQTEFPEPRVRYNTDSATGYCPDWDEAAAWDRLADYYQTIFNIPTR